MFDSLISQQGVSLLFVFFEGLLSFFSPCILPLIPVYISYLAGNAKQTLDDGTILYNRKKVFLHTIFFVLGISFSFFILGMSFTALGTFFQSNQLLFTRIGGIVILILGCYQLGIFDFKFLQRERKINLNFNRWNMNPLVACIMGFTFSFAWTPCVGPALSSVLIMASSANSPTIGNLLVFLYTLGFTLPFLLLGLFTTQVLTFLKKNKKLVKYTVKAGGIILIIIGIMTFTGWMNGFSKYLTSFTPSYDSSSVVSPPEDNNSNDSGSNVDNIKDGNTNQEVADENVTDENATDEDSSKDPIPAPDFTLIDQYGTAHTLSDYKGKVIFLNFWATWCGPCRVEMPDIESLYQDYGLNSEDVIILGIANPSSDDYPRNQDVSKEEIIAYLEDNQLTFPVVFDETGELFGQYYISSFPTTFLIDAEGNIFGYAAGMMSKSLMDNAIKQTKDSVAK